MKFSKWLVFAILGFVISACAGTELEGKAQVVSKLIKIAEKNGAYKCAPKQLALSKTHLEFSLDEMSQGKMFKAKNLLKTADQAARLAIKKSPPEKCAKKVIVATEPEKKPVKLSVKVTDSDGDGIPDSKDKCPNKPEDFDGFEDKDGCPDKDNDGDGIADSVDKCPGKDKDKENNFKDVAEDIDGFEDKDGCPDKDNDGDGIADSVDKCPGKDKDKENNFKDVAEDIDGFEDDDGCPDKDNDKDGIPDVKDKCPNKPEVFNGYLDKDGCPDKLKLIKITKKKIELKQKIFFAYNKAKIRKKSYGLLNEIYKVLKSRPSMKIMIEGHTDSDGSASYNRRLSRRRARAVRKYLIKKGVDPSRMKSVGRGESKPIASNKTKAGKSKNRRVEFVITKQ
ncbi:MAG: OmpA family protein [Myxococcota bacterium]